MSTALKTPAAIKNRKGLMVTLPSDFFSRTPEKQAKWATNNNVAPEELETLFSKEENDSEVSNSTESATACSTVEHNLIVHLVGDTNALIEDLPETNFFRVIVEAEISKLPTEEIISGAALTEEEAARFNHIEMVYGMQSPIKEVAESAKKALLDPKYTTDDAVEYRMLLEKQESATKDILYSKDALKFVDFYLDLCSFTASKVTEVPSDSLPTEYEGQFVVANS